MKHLTLAFGLSLLQVASGVAAAGAHDAVRSGSKQQAVEAARSSKHGEGNPVPAPSAKVSSEDRKAARAARLPEGALQARTHPVGEGNPIPPATTKVPRDQRAEARANRKTESRRANKAGEITSKGEASY